MSILTGRTKHDWTGAGRAEGGWIESRWTGAGPRWVRPSPGGPVLVDPKWVEPDTNQIQLTNHREGQTARDLRAERVRMGRSAPPAGLQGLHT
ncbi:unnamed protein product [Linum trigynum]|uniref:Uncharacterized protein n=1 Tax=Linum trigynum TaxID=586398 RepID=A0AAV2FR20_9ROSI